MSFTKRALWPGSLGSQPNPRSQSASLTHAIAFLKTSSPNPYQIQYLLCPDNERNSSHINHRKESKGSGPVHPRTFECLSRILGVSRGLGQKRGTGSQKEVVTLIYPLPRG